MRTLVFTICARNYIGLAKVLGRSLQEQGGGADFRIYVAEGDADDPGDPAVVPASDALRDLIPPVEYANMAFMYDVTEFCTALKAACFRHAFADGYDACLYMDPDIFLTAPVALITDAFDGAAILMTPHLCRPATGEGPRADHGILATGIYNLGFLGVRATPEAVRFLAWWDTRLRTQAFNDHHRSLYTDQRWMDFVPALFDAAAVRVWRDLGANVAPWNYHERIIAGTAHPIVRARDDEDDAAYRLLFMHFSGFDFRRILDGQFVQLNLADMTAAGDLQPLYDRYGDAIRAEAGAVARHLDQPYGYAAFADGLPVLPSHRRLFRIWRERHGDAAEPFATGFGTFHAALAARGLLGREGSGDLAADKATARSVPDPARLLGRAQRVFRLLFRVIGRARFFFLVRALNRVSHIEQHYDTFGLDDAAVLRAAERPR